MTRSAGDDFRRCVRFLNEIEDRSAARTEKTRFGTAFFHPTFPVKWDLNYVRVDPATPPPSARAAAADADEVQRAAGLKHRKIIVYDEHLGEELAPGFRDLGWRVQRLVLMVHGGGPLQPPRVPVREATWEEVRPAMLDTYVREDRNAPDEAEVLTDSHIVTRSATAVRYFVADRNGRIAGWCELYSDGATGQIENVGTFTEYRGLGIARSVVSRAVEESAAAGNDLHFLVADDDDWPKELYAKLGFAPVGRTYEFVLRPD